MPNTKQPCDACGLRKGHRPGCVNDQCQECGMTVGHDRDCSHAPNNEIERNVALDEAGVRRTTVDGEEAEILFDGTTGGPKGPDPVLLEIPQEDLIHQITTKRDEILAQERVVKREKGVLSGLNESLAAMIDALCERDKRARDLQLGLNLEGADDDGADNDGAPVDPEPAVV